MDQKTVDVPPTPTEVLIPEARHHRRRRYLRTGFFAVVAALVTASLVVGAVILFGGPGADGKVQARVPVATTSGGGIVYFRPVLCLAPPFSSQAPAASGTLTCSPSTQLTEANLGVSPNGTGFTANNVEKPDTALEGAPSTSPSAHHASSTVLLPGLSSNGGTRYLLGPAQMTGTSIISAAARRDQTTGKWTGRWVVDYTTNRRGVAILDKVAEQNFHQLLAVELDGVVYSTPLIQPTLVSFTTFDGRGEIGGSLTKADAIKLAHAINQYSGFSSSTTQ
jgi:hypothetical protein